MPVSRIYLIRHGETTWNTDKRWQGQLDVPLNDLGREQARYLAEYLRQRPVTAVYASDLQRASETGAIIAQTLGLQTHTDARLREIHLGVLQGLTIDEIHASYAHELEMLKKDWLNYQVEGGETRKMMLDRAYEAVSEIADRQADTETAVVTHGGVVRVLLTHLFPEISEGRQVQIGNTSLTVLAREEGVWRLEILAQTPHLPSELGNGTAQETL